MSEKVLEEILERMVLNEYAEIENIPDHKFSLKHRFAMKRIFARYERNVCKLNKKDNREFMQTAEYKPRSIKQRIIIMTLVIILMSLLVGWVVMYVSEKFHGTVYHDHTQLAAVEIENSPTTITDRYALASIPKEFEVIEIDPSPIDVFTLYKNKQTGQEITLRQCVKSKFATNYNTEQHSFEEITINGKTGLYINFSTNEYCQSLLVWDNEDYIIEIIADLDKERTVNLSKINKV